MNKQENVVKLLLVVDSVEDAEQLISVLRNGGIALRPSRAASIPELEEQLAVATPDLILVDITSKLLGLSTVAEIANRGGKDITVIAVAYSPTEDVIVDAFRDGARALALRGRDDHLQSIVKREYESLKMRRTVRLLENALRETEKRCDSLLDSSRDPIAYVHEGMHVRANKAYLEMFNLEELEEIEGVSILDMVAPEHTDNFKKLLKQLSKGEKPPAKLELKARRSDGSTFDAEMEFASANYEGEPCLQIIFRQQLENIELAKQLDSLRSRDLVTDLYNRPYCLGELERMASEAAQGKSDQVLLLMEPDSFQKVLDTIGLGNTDLLLGDLAGLLRRNLSDTAVAGRFGDHTFGILLRECSMETARQLAEGLLKAFEEYIFEVGKQSISLSVSIGGTLIGEKSANPQVILTQAADALKAAQSEGGHRINLIDPAEKDKAEAEKNRHWLKLLQDALAHDNFVLFYQPIISLQGAEGDFFEILLRMKGPQGEIAPNFFLPIAAQHGLLPAIDRWVIEAAIKALAERERKGQKTTFFIKLTPQSLEDQTLLPWIAQHLKNARLRGDALVFEMPESKVITALKPARAFVTGLKQLHCGFALEQFGSGLNSFQLLKHVDANYLKLDRIFMADLAKSKESQERIKSLCDQARHADKLTVAEFVEDAASMSILFSCGVNFVQGNFLQEPEKVMAAGGD